MTKSKTTINTEIDNLLVQIIGDYKLHYIYTGALVHADFIKKISAYPERFKKLYSSDRNTINVRLNRLQNEEGLIGRDDNKNYVLTELGKQYYQKILAEKLK